MNGKNVKQIKREYDFLTQPGGGDHPGWKFRPLFDAFCRATKYFTSSKKRYGFEAINENGFKVNAEIAPSEAKRIKGLMKKKFLFARSELFVRIKHPNGNGIVKLNMREFPVFSILEHKIETNPLEDSSHYEDPGN